MPNVLTQATNLAVADETTLGVQPTSGWFNLQPNSYGDVGASLKKVARKFISKNRQSQKPILVDLDSAVPFEHDLTKDLLDKFGPGIFCSIYKHSGGTGLSLFRPTAVVDGGVGDDSYTVAASGGLAANILIAGRGFTNSANNGVKVTVASTATAIKVATGTLVAEAAPPANATVDVVGVQAGVAADIQMSAAGNITATALNLTTIGLTVGQWIYIPSAAEATAMGSANYAFANTAYTGFARITAIAAGQLTLDRRSWTVGAADVAAGKTIRLFFSRWVRNVAFDHADYLRTSYQFEIQYTDMGGAGTPKYEYPAGNVLDEWMVNFNGQSKATVSLNFVGTDTAKPTTTRATGASTALSPVAPVAVSTATDLMRMRIAKADETGQTTDFKNIKISLTNNVAPEKQLGSLPALLMNVGDFEGTVDAEAIMTDSDVLDQLRDNNTVAFDVASRNPDFGALWDISSANLDEGDRNFPMNMSVTIKSKTTGFQDATLATTASLSVFGYLPQA